MIIFPEQIISLFANGNAKMLSAGQKSLMANCLSFFLFGFYTVYSSLFLALGKGTAGMNGILYAQSIADVLSAIITVFMAIHLHKELKKAETITSSSPKGS